MVNIAIIGASGNVGIEIKRCLEDSDIDIGSMIFVGSSKSSNNKIKFQEKKFTTVLIDEIDFTFVDIAFFCTPADISKKFIEIALSKNVIVIDKSTAFRMDSRSFLTVNEINVDKAISSLNSSLNRNQLKDTIGNSCRKGVLISNPNCCVIPLSVILFFLKQINSISRVIASTYQSVSGVGLRGNKELYDQVERYISTTQKNYDHNSNNHDKYKIKSIDKSIFNGQIAFNVIPQIGDINEYGDSEEEEKISQEILRILDIECSVTCVRVPTFISHGISVNVEFENYVDINDIIASFNKNSDIIEFIDNSSIAGSNSLIENATPINSNFSNKIYVSRLRKDKSIRCGGSDNYNLSKAFNLWISCDNLRKGAALNAVQVASKIITNFKNSFKF
ncbi:MAG TPA: aspartate-semialdehyde dehydrogenase [Candidatus Megaira endosymbiont of Hartmannula sinica]|nr:aspartate-semialdehyde dehydrogenase [Candidatus Megaera endosymbiont of Hartmannula sinica]